MAGWFPFATALPAPLRAKAMLAIVGIVVVGLGLITMAVLLARAAKRRARHRLGPSKPFDDTWYKRPLATAPEGDVSSEPGGSEGEEGPDGRDTPDGPDRAGDDDR